MQHSPAPDVAFVFTNHVSSSTYRGLLVARALNQTFLRCSEFARSRRVFDVVVHLKLPCVGALAHGRHHVIDHIDALPDRYASFRRMLGNFSAQIFNTDEHLNRECCTRVCMVIPHHCNLPCSNSVERRGLRRVGLIGWTQASLSVANALQAAGSPADHEPKGRWHTFGHGPPSSGRPAEICSFFDSLGIAVAWNEDQESYDPAQRFTNPICLGIPTIGYARQASFRAYGSTFLCDTVACIQRRIEQIRTGRLRDEFQTLSRRVRAHVGWKATQGRYQALFAAVSTQCSSPPCDDDDERSQKLVRRLFNDTYASADSESARCGGHPGSSRLRRARLRRPVLWEVIK